jgi:hypothetical protein
MAKYFSDSDMPNSRLELTLTSHRDGTHDAMLCIYIYDRGEPITVSALSDKHLAPSMFAGQDETALHQGIRKLGRNKTKELVMRFLDNGGSAYFREAFMNSHGDYGSSERKKFYAFIDDHLYQAIFVQP